jgi:plastocyanin
MVAVAAAVIALTGTVGPGFTIGLRYAGKPVHHLAPGRYRITLVDRSPIHDFRLRGPGVNVATGVEFVGKRTFVVKLRRGTYRYVCDPHADLMHGSFVVS